MALTYNYRNAPCPGLGCPICEEQERLRKEQERRLNNMDKDKEEALCNALGRPYPNGNRTHATLRPEEWRGYSLFDHAARQDYLNISKQQIDIILLRECIAHWKRMILWARLTQPELAAPWDYVMHQYLGEHWKGEFCSLCHVYADKEKIKCTNCPLYKVGHWCDRVSRHGNVWAQVNRAPDWLSWLRYAGLMLQLLQNTLTHVSVSQTWGREDYRHEPKCGVQV